MPHETQPTPAPKALSSWWPLLLLAPVLATAFLFSRHSLSDLDIWLHWRVGRDILAGHLPSTNHYSYTYPDRPWVDHEWLFQVLAALAGKLALLWGKAGGPDTLATAWNALRTVLVLGLVLVLGRPVPGRRQPAPSRWAWVLASVMLAMGLLWARMTIRPELISYLMLAAALPTVEGCLGTAPATPFRWRSCVSFGNPCGRLFWLTFLWAQMHGFAALAPVLLLLAGLLFPLQNRLWGGRARFPGRRWARALLMSCLALGLTPAGWRGWTYPLAVVGQFTGGGPDLQGIISELVPLSRAPNSLAWTIVLFRICLAWGLVRMVLSFPRPNLLRSLVFLLAAAAAWNGQRNLGLMAVALVLLQRGAAGPGPGWWRRAASHRLAAPVLAALPVALVAALGLWWVPRIPNDSFYLHEGVGRRFGGGLTPAQYPVAAADALADRGACNVLANLDAAAFVLGNTSSRLHIDGRTEAYPPSAWARYQRLLHGDLSTLADKGPRATQAICLALGSGASDRLAVNLLKAPKRWPLAAAGPGGLLWLRRGQPGATGGFDPSSAVADALRQAAGQKDPTRAADLCLAAARLARLTGDQAQAQRALQTGLQRRPDHPQLLHNLGNLELTEGAYAAAGDHFARAVAANPRLSGSALNAGVCAMRRERPREAASWFQKAVAIDPDDFQGWANLGTARLQSGDRTAAIAAFERAVSLHPQDARLHGTLDRLRRQGR